MKSSNEIYEVYYCWYFYCRGKEPLQTIKDDLHNSSRLFRRKDKKNHTIMSNVKF